MNAPARFNIEAEQALLGAIILNNDALGAAIKHVRTEDFFEPFHGQIFQEISRLITSGRKVTPITLKDAFPNIRVGDQPDDPTVSQYLSRLCAEATTIINAPDYAQLIHELAIIRDFIAIARDLERAPADGYNVDTCVRGAFERLDTLRLKVSGAEQRLASISELAKRLVANAEYIRTGNPAPIPSTGLTDLDKQIGAGFRAGRLYVFAGRPGMGKTILMASSARRTARRGFGVGIFSLEVDGEEISARIMADELAQTNHTPIVYRDILTGELNDGDRAALSNASERVRDLQIEVDASGGLTFFDIAARSRILVERWKKRNIQPGVIWVDYLGLITPSDRYRGRKVDELGEIAKAAKDLSKEIGVGVVLLSQLNRMVESRDDKRPAMSDLRDSGNIEEHADIVGLLYRPAYYDQRDPKIHAGDLAAIERAENRKFDLEIGLGKNRLGPTKTIKLWCDVSRSTIDNSAKGFA